jgi:hypothetical protein
MPAKVVTGAMPHGQVECSFGGLALQPAALQRRSAQVVRRFGRRGSHSSLGIRADLADGIRSPLRRFAPWKSRHDVAILGCDWHHEGANRIWWPAFGQLISSFEFSTRH